MSTSFFFISCQDETCTPSVCKPFEVAIEHFDTDFKPHFHDLEKLQAFVQRQVDAKFAELASNSRDRDHARAESPKISVSNNGKEQHHDHCVLTIEMDVTFVSNNDAGTSTRVPEMWKIDMNSKKIVEEEDESKKIFFQQDEKKNHPTSTSSSSPATKSSSSTSASQQQEQQQFVVSKEIKKPEQSEENTQKKKDDDSTCVIC
jgi:hypothetical protein